MTADRSTGQGAVVLLSGGVDSAVALWWAVRQGWDVTPISYDYYRRPPGEARAVDSLVAAAGTRKAIRVPLPFLREMDDVRESSLRNSGLLEAPVAYVPARNLIFYSLAAHYAELEGARWIVGGHNGADGEMFPDATSGFFATLNDALRQGLFTYDGSPLEVVLPLLGRTKADVVKLGLEWGVPLGRTWSCWWDRDAPCGECMSCVERREAFATASATDGEPG